MKEVRFFGPPGDFLCFSLLSLSGVVVVLFRFIGRTKS